MGTKDLTNINVDALFEKISALIEESRKKVAKAVNIAEVYTKYEIAVISWKMSRRGSVERPAGSRCCLFFLGS